MLLGKLFFLQLQRILLELDVEKFQNFERFCSYLLNVHRAKLYCFAFEYFMKTKLSLQVKVIYPWGETFRCH